MARTVVIDHLPTAAEKFRDTHVIVAVAVIRETTTATVALHLGREVYVARDSDEAFVLAEDLVDPLLCGELGGNVPYGFHMSNSPVQMFALAQVPAGPFTNNDRPVILVSSSGTQLMVNANGSEAVYLACLRNYNAVADYIDGRHEKVAVIGAGTRGVFRREDQLLCSWLADRLCAAGYNAEDERTAELIAKWQGADVEAIRTGRSAEYLRETGQLHDLEFILHQVDDLDIVPAVVDHKLSVVSGTLIDGRAAHQI
jgi:2-phosphosulfolactate phosphatase